MSVEITNLYASLPDAEVISIIMHKLKQRNEMTQNFFNEIISLKSVFEQNQSPPPPFLFVAPCAYEGLLFICELQKERLYFTAASWRLLDAK
jgi:hypothetical protein